MNETIASHPLAFFTGMALGALFVGLVAGLIPLVAGATTNQKRLGVSGFFASLVGGFVAGGLIAIPIALGFTVKIVLDWKKTKAELQQADSKTHGT